MAKIKIKTHKGSKKRFRVSATGKVKHKRCGSSHLMSHKSGKQVRRLRKKPILRVAAEAHRFRRALQEREGTSPELVAFAKRMAEQEAVGTGEPGPAPPLPESQPAEYAGGQAPE
jgi:large subunit ribosomal protein L35